MTITIIAKIIHTKVPQLIKNQIKCDIIIITSNSNAGVLLPTMECDVAVVTLVIAL